MRDRPARRLGLPPGSNGRRARCSRRQDEQAGHRDASQPQVASSNSHALTLASVSNVLDHASSQL
jgi:hypothetical protein